jgi:hypothetical protein
LLIEELAARSFSPAALYSFDLSMLPKYTYQLKRKAAHVIHVERCWF